MSGYLRTAVLLAVLTALFMAIGWAIGGQQGMVIAFLVACATNLWAWWGSDRMVLSMQNAQPVGPAEAPQLYQMVGALAQRAGLPMPRLYLIHEAQPNAFATGRNPQNAAVAVNTGLLDIMSEQEAAGVIAHELAHIRNRDTLLMTITATLAGAIGMLAQFGYFFAGARDQNGERRSPFGPIAALLMMILAPLAAGLVQMAISRAREYEADRVGGEICGDPRWLASALQKLEAGRATHVNEAAEANPATAHMFIVNPLSGLRMDALFTTHPATANRVAALLQQAAAMGLGGGGSGGGFGGGGRRPAAPQAAPARRPSADNPWGAVGGAAGGATGGAAGGAAGEATGNGPGGTAPPPQYPPARNPWA